MKLNIRQTVSIGFAFLTIMMLWQVYNWYIPLFLNSFLENLFSGDKLIVGIIMALDNLFAIFMIPLMSYFSDRTKTRFGRRVPYIIVGIVLSAITFAMLPYVNEMGSIWLLIGNILLVLISMNIYRSPCVALMPDVTPKKLRSKANSIINIMGGSGVAIGYLTIIFFSKSNNTVPFLIVSSLMIIFLTIFLIIVRENRMVADYHKALKEAGLSIQEEGVEEDIHAGAAKTNRRNVYLVLLVVFLVYMSSNAVETFISLYSEAVFGAVGPLPFNMNPGALVIVPFGIASFALAVPAAFLADHIGRKMTVVLGVILMAISYAGIGFLGFISGFSLWLLLLFFIGGGGFSLIIVNIYPMVIENCSVDNVGRYTGHYYTASMLAQSITPALSGLFISGLVFANMRALFPYAFIFTLLALVVLFFVQSDRASQ